MRLARFAFMVLSWMVIGLAALSGNGFIVSAKTGGQCTPLSPDDLKAAKDACAKAGPNTACVAADSVQASLTSDGTFAKQGDQVDLTKVTTLTTSAASDVSANGGIVALKLQAGLPEADPAVPALLYGASHLTATVQPANAPPATADASGPAGQAFTLSTRIP